MRKVFAIIAVGLLSSFAIGSYLGAEAKVRAVPPSVAVVTPLTDVTLRTGWSNRIGTRRVVMPRGTYLVKKPLVFLIPDNSVTVDMRGVTLDVSQWAEPVEVPIVKIGQIPGKSCNDLKWDGLSIDGTTSMFNAGDRVAVELMNVKQSYIRLGTLNYVGIGLRAIADGQTCEFNKIGAVQILAKRDLQILARNGGACNGNEIHGTCLAATHADAIMVDIQSRCDLHFFGGSMEANPCIAVQTVGHDTLGFFGTRFETHDNAKLILRYPAGYRKPDVYSVYDSFLQYVEY